MQVHRSGRFGRRPLVQSILLALAPVIALPFTTGVAFAACTTAGTTVTCATGSSTNNLSNSTANVTVNVQTGAVVSSPPIVGGNSLTLTGNGITLNNQGTIDPTTNSAGLSLVMAGSVLGNASANTIAVNNLAGGSMRGMFNIATLFGFGGQALTVQNGAGGTTTIANAGTIGMSLLGGGNTADAGAVVTYGGANANLTNTGTITGRIGLGAASSGSNTFLNAGTVNGSIYLGDSAAGSTFTPGRFRPLLYTFGSYPAVPISTDVSSRVTSFSTASSPFLTTFLPTLIALRTLTMSFVRGALTVRSSRMTASPSRNLLRIAIRVAAFTDRFGRWYS